jgi:hypothetical protein
MEHAIHATRGGNSHNKTQSCALQQVRPYRCSSDMNTSHVEQNWTSHRSLNCLTSFGICSRAFYRIMYVRAFFNIRLHRVYCSLNGRLFCVENDTSLLKFHSQVYLAQISTRNNGGACGRLRWEDLLLR